MNLSQSNSMRYSPYRNETTIMKERFDQRLKRLRMEKGLTAQAMAEAIEVPGSTYRDWESGKGLRIPPLEKISQVLAISVTEFVTGRQGSKTDLVNDLTAIEEKLREIRITVGSLE
jgi:transcriptional regulator with XRE-family HTH domain